MSAKLALQLQFDMRGLHLWAVFFSLRRSFTACFSSVFCSDALTKKQGGAFAEREGQEEGKGLFECLFTCSQDPSRAQ